MKSVIYSIKDRIRNKVLMEIPRYPNQMYVHLSLTTNIDPISHIYMQIKGNLEQTGKYNFIL
jgi:hypothetical protein